MIQLLWECATDCQASSSARPDRVAASLYTRSGKWKHVIVVDEDINLEDPNEIFWALTTRFQPATDMYVIPRSITSSLEPSARADGLTSKLMLDLTIKENFRGEVAEPRSKRAERFCNAGRNMVSNRR
jgi:UbiD family decarboxylase